MLGLGSNTQLGIGISISLADRFSNQAKAVNQQLLQMRKNATGAVDGAVRSYRNQAATIAAGAAGISMAMYSMAESGAKFQHSINQIAIVGGKDLKKSRRDLAAFAKDLSTQFTRNPQEIAGAMFENVKAGVTAGLENITKYQIAVATATDEMLEGEQGVATGLLNIMNAMNLGHNQFARVANAVTMAANASQASVLSLNESMQYFASTARSANIPLEETLALVAKLSQSGIRGSAAGTALSNFVMHGLKSSGPFAGKQAGKAWGMLGLNPQQMSTMIGQGKAFEVMRAIEAASGKLPNDIKLDVLDKLFGVRGQKALINSFGNADPSKTLEGLLKSIKEGVSSDVSMRQSKAMQNDLYSDMKFLANAFHNFKIAFVEAAGPTIRVMLGVFTKVIKVFGWIANTPVGKVLVGIVAVAIPLIAVLFAFRTAALTAAIALRGFSSSSAVGGFSGLLQGALGSAGLSGVGSAVTRNAAGRLAVRAGQTVNFGGKVFKGGQLLPKAFAAGAGGFMGKMGNFLGFSSLAAGSGAGSKVVGMLGKSLPWLAKIGGFALRWLPVVGWIWAAFDIIKGIYGLFHEERAEKRKLDPLFEDYYRNLDNQIMGYNKPNNYYSSKYGLTAAQQRQQASINQQIMINIDGKTAMDQKIDQVTDEQFNNQLNFNLTH